MRNKVQMCVYLQSSIHIEVPVHIAARIEANRDDDTNPELIDALSELETYIDEEQPKVLSVQDNMGVVDACLLMGEEIDVSEDD